MPPSPSQRLPPDGQPYDTANGLRIGAFIGALAGAGLTGIFGAGVVWVVFVGAAAGGACGYGYKQRRLDQWRRTH